MITLIACISKNRGLGLNNQLLYKIPADMKFFREKTARHTVVMGKNTFISIGRSLPNRTNIVVTRDKNFKADGVIICHSVDDAIAAARGPSSVAEDGPLHDQEIFIIGGAQIYEQTINKADKLYLTVVDDTKTADAFFPKYDEFTKSTVISQDEHGGLKYKILELTKK